MKALAALPIIATALVAGCATAPAESGANGRVIHSPWLGLRFEQDGRELPLYTRDTLRTEVSLAAAPFTIVLPVRGEDDLYRITAWDDASILVAANPDLADVPPYFGEATGMADTAAGSGLLMLNREGHHYLTGLRLGPDPARHVFHVSEVLRLDGQSRETLQIEDARSPLYLVAWFDEDNDGVMRHGEYEFLVLHLTRDSR